MPSVWHSGAAFAEGQVWMNMIKRRALTSHTYNDDLLRLMDELDDLLLPYMIDLSLFCQDRSRGPSRPHSSCWHHLL
jgi:hypothetical protein